MFKLLCVFITLLLPGKGFRTVPSLNAVIKHFKGVFKSVLKVLNAEKKKCYSICYILTEAGGEATFTHSLVVLFVIFEILQT